MSLMGFMKRKGLELANFVLLTDGCEDGDDSEANILRTIERVRGECPGIKIHLLVAGGGSAGLLEGLFEAGGLSTLASTEFQGREVVRCVMESVSGRRRGAGTLFFYATGAGEPIVGL